MNNKIKTILICIFLGSLLINFAKGQTAISYSTSTSIYSTSTEFISPSSYSEEQKKKILDYIEEKYGQMLDPKTREIFMNYIKQKLEGKALMPPQSPVFKLIAPSEEKKEYENDITLTWSTDTYVPSGYLGKPLPVRGSEIEVVANIETKKLNPKTLYYQWSLDNQTNKRKCGIGKSTFKFTATLSDGEKHMVKLVIKKGEQEIAEKHLFIPIVCPQIVLKTINPVEKSIDKITVGSYEKLKLAAIPYFFNTKSLSELDYKWTFEGKPAKKITAKNPNILILQVPKISTSEIKTLSLEVKSKSNKIKIIRPVFFQP